MEFTDGDLNDAEDGKVVRLASIPSDFTALDLEPEYITLVVSKT